jgi:hypothetical protein
MKVARRILDPPRRSVQSAFRAVRVSGEETEDGQVRRRWARRLAFRRVPMVGGSGVVELVPGWRVGQVVGRVDDGVARGATLRRNVSVPVRMSTARGRSTAPPGARGFRAPGRLAADSARPCGG